MSRERAFSADASHQLRTPIAGLRVRVESALLSPDSDARHALAEMLPPIDRLETTVDDLLRLARDADVDRAPLDAPVLLREAEDHWRGLVGAHGRTLRIVVEDDLPLPVVAEPAVRQILDVLISNAYRHGRGTITVAARSSAPGAVVLQVGDEGHAVLDPRTIFERRTGESHGVGLALARVLAEAEGARLVLEHPGPGPVFALRSSAPSRSEEGQPLVVVVVGYTGLGTFGGATAAGGCPWASISHRCGRHHRSGGSRRRTAPSCRARPRAARRAGGPP